MPDLRPGKGAFWSVPLLSVLWLYASACGPGETSTPEGNAGRTEGSRPAERSKKGPTRVASGCPPEDVIRAAAKGEVEALAACLDNGGDPWAVLDNPEESDSTYSALYLAAANGHAEVIELLTSEYGVAPEWAGCAWCLPLITAIQRCHTSAVEALLEAGVHPDHGYWITPLQAAMEALGCNDGATVVQRLLDAGADPNFAGGDLVVRPFDALMVYLEPDPDLLSAYLAAGACVTTSQLVDVRHRAAGGKPELVELRDQLENHYDPECTFSMLSDEIGQRMVEVATIPTPPHEPAVATSTSELRSLVRW